MVPERERVAVVNQAAISTNDVEAAIREVKQLSAAYGQEWKPLSVEEDPNALDLQDVLTNVIDSELKAQDARARGLDRKPEVQQRLAYLERSFFAQEWDRLQRDLLTPSAAEVQKFYDQNKQSFIEPEAVHLRQIVVDTLAKAEGLRTRAVQGEPFTVLAQEQSVGEGKERGGDIGWYIREQDLRVVTAVTGTAPQEKAFLNAALEAVAFALEQGQISQPVKGTDGRYYIFQLEARRSPRQRQEVEVHDWLKGGLLMQKVQEQLDQLRKKATIKEHPERLESVEQ